MSESNPYARYVEGARDFIESGELDSVEMDYKLKFIEDLQPARAAVLQGLDEWVSLLSKPLRNTNLNFP